MADTIYTLGYQPWQPELIRATAEQLDAVVMDVRYRAFARNPSFTRQALKSILGDRYVHVPAFGNMNYKGHFGNDVVLANPERGLEQAKAILASGRQLIVMCACARHASCHRLDVSRVLAKALGAKVKHLYPTDAPAPRTPLFG